MSMQPTPHRFGSPDYSQRRPRVILVGLIALCGLFVYGYNGRLAELDQVRSQIIVEEAQLDAAMKKNATLLDLFADVVEAAHVGPMAREILGYVLPGDKSLTIVKTTPAASVAASPSDEHLAPISTPSRSAPVWQQWVEFFAADAARPR